MNAHHFNVTNNATGNVAHVFTEFADSREKARKKTIRKFNNIYDKPERAAFTIEA